MYMMRFNILFNQIDDTVTAIPPEVYELTNEEDIYDDNLDAPVIHEILRN